MDKDANRDPETEGEINSRRKEKAELWKGYREARQELPDSPADYPWGYTELPTRNPAGNVIPPLWEILRDEALSVSGAERRGSVDFEEGYPPVEPIAHVIGPTRLFPHYWSPGQNDGLARDLDGEEATRVYLYLDLSPLPEYKVASRIDQADVREGLGIENSVSQSTLNRMPGRMDAGLRTFYASETETLVRQWEGTKFEEWVCESERPRLSLPTVRASRRSRPSCANSGRRRSSTSV